ncbi:MAG: ABC transporter permease [Ktedonobacterales bacterium]
MIGYLRLEVARSLRDARFLILALVAPVGFYLLFAGLFGGGSAGTISVAEALMVSLSVYGIMFAVTLATGPRIAQDRGIGWQRQLRLLPVAPRSVLLARLLAAVALALPALALVLLTAVLTHGIHLDAGKWIALVVVLWVTSVPFAVLGVAIGYATGSEAAFGVLYALSVVLSALGGLWMPITLFPTGLQVAGKLLPTYRAADLGLHIVAGKGLDFSDILLLVAWTIVFCLLALFFSARMPQSR